MRGRMAGMWILPLAGIAGIAIGLLMVTGRYSLRSLLIAITLIAILLGLVDFVARK